MLVSQWRVLVLEPEMEVVRSSSSLALLPRAERLHSRKGRLPETEMAHVSGCVPRLSGGQTPAVAHHLHERVRLFRSLLRNGCRHPKAAMRQRGQVPPVWEERMWEERAFQERPNGPRWTGCFRCLVGSRGLSRSRWR